MPMNRARYPDNWEAIATEVKEKANWHCEECGKPCLRPNEDWFTFCSKLLHEGSRWYEKTRETVYDEEAGEWGDVEKKNRFRLTTAHVNHDPENPNAELKALCAPAISATTAICTKKMPPAQDTGSERVRDNCR